MCLEYCHVTRKIIDNDYPCTACAPEMKHAHIEDDCSRCRHEVTRTAASDMCALTKMPLPLMSTCCHWNVDLCEEEYIVLSNDSIHETVRHYQNVSSIKDLFDNSETAPDYETLDGNRIKVKMDELSAPWVYGVSAWDWDDALGNIPEATEQWLHPRSYIKELGG